MDWDVIRIGATFFCAGCFYLILAVSVTITLMSIGEKEAEPYQYVPELCQRVIDEICSIAALDEIGEPCEQVD